MRIVYERFDRAPPPALRMRVQVRGGQKLQKKGENIIRRKMEENIGRQEMLK